MLGGMSLHSPWQAWPERDMMQTGDPRGATALWTKAGRMQNPEASSKHGAWDGLVEPMS